MSEPIEERDVESASGGSKPEHGDDSRAKEGNDDLKPSQSNLSIAETLSPIREVLFVALICSAQLLTQAGLTQTLALLHVIGDDFNITNPGQLSWLIAGYSLTVGTFILIAGRFGDVYGYKRMLIIGFSWFSLWSMIGGVSVYSNEVLFVFSRVLSGIGPSICLPNALAILGATYNPGKRKNMVFAFFGAVAPGGGIIGAAFGGVFALAWWPWAYWSMSLALAGVAVASYFIIPAPPVKIKTTHLTLWGHIQELDLPGAFVGITSLVLINFAWNQAPIVGWQEAYVYVLLIIGVLLVPLFFYIELRLASSPLIPFDALNGDVAFVLGCIACGWGAFGIWLFYGWQTVNVLRGASVLLTVAYFSPVAISGACASVVTGILLGIMRPAWIMVCSLSAFLTGIILFATMPLDQIYWAQIFVAAIITPWGMDMSFPSGTLILSNAVSKENQGIAASLITTVVNYSISLALGFAGTVEVNITKGDTSPEAMLRGFRSAMYMGVGLAGLGLAISIMFLLKSYIKDARDSKNKTAE